MFAQLVTADRSHEFEVLIAGMIAVITGLIGMMWLLVRTLAHSKEAATNAGQANAAVNNTGPGEHRLCDKITNMQESLGVLSEAQKDFSERGWRSLPADIGTAVGLTEVIRDLQHKDVDVAARLDRLQVVLVQHVEREKRRDGVEAD